jgi:hypothetical protein
MPQPLSDKQMLSILYRRRAEKEERVKELNNQIQEITKTIKALERITR